MPQTVADDHTYFVADSVGTAHLAAWVHNACRSQAAQYEEDYRASKGVDPKQPRIERRFAGNTPSGNRYADVIFPEDGVEIGGDSKRIANWSGSLYNPNGTAGHFWFAKKAVTKLVDQAADYLAKWPIYEIRTNSLEFIAEYTQRFADAGLEVSRIRFDFLP